MTTMSDNMRAWIVALGIAAVIILAVGVIIAFGPATVTVTQR
jgi:hypothetical protein